MSESLHKVSVALPRDEYMALVEFCAEATSARGSRVTHVAVMRQVLRQMLADDYLRKRTTAEVELKRP